VLVRFAPSPTGYLHVGNARVALWNWLFARHAGGRFLLRLDDTDAARSRPEFAAAIEEDLRWLGLDWDQSFHQSARLARYAEAAERLKRAGRLYPCYETPEELDWKRKLRLKRGQPPVYDRFALAMTPEQRARKEAEGIGPHWRFKLSEGRVRWRDLVRGPAEFGLAGEVSDPVLVRADGAPLYTFSSVVDDLETGVTHVIRGEDHVANTAAQLDLYAALGGDPAALRFGHLPLLQMAGGGKVSKRDQGGAADAAAAGGAEGAAGIGRLTLRRLRHDGIEPLALASLLARLGTSAEIAPAAALAELVAEFDLGRASRAAPQFDPAMLLELNRRVLHGLSFAEAQPRLAALGLPETAGERFWLAVRGNLDLLAEAREWWEVVAGGIVPPPAEGEGDYLREAAALLPPEPWDEGAWAAWTGALKEATGRKGRALFHPLRLALTGAEQGPEMARLLPLIGRARAHSRLLAAAC